MGIQSELASNGVVTQAYALIKNVSMTEARQILDDVYPTTPDNKELGTIIGFCSFWEDVLRSSETLPPFEQGEIILDSWNRFYEHMRKKNPAEETVYAFKKGIYTHALRQYTKVADEKDAKLHAEVCRKKGLCNKRLGSYEIALQCLAEANSTQQGQAAVLAEMADCYDLCGETKPAKVLFKEAFYIDAAKVDLANLDSPLIKELVAHVQKEGYKEAVLKEWIPVYGMLLGVFNVKRPLRAQELGHLKQDIYAKENELKDPSTNSSIITPRLLTMYLWLMDYYLLSKESMQKINEVLLKIKLLDPVVYKKYLSFDE